MKENSKSHAPSQTSGHSSLAHVLIGLERDIDKLKNEIDTHENRIKSYRETIRSQRNVDFILGN
jgi:peptidoglycan hydrolase CwlO-like protein